MRSVSLRSLRPVIRWDAAFTRRLLYIAIPIMVQNLVSSSLHIIDGVMIGQLGDAPYAAVTQATRYTFLFQLTLFGVASGSSIFLSQFWGSRNIDRMRAVMGMCLRLTVPVALVFGGAAVLFPQVIVGFFLPAGDSAEFAKQYLAWVAPGFLLSAVDVVYSTAMKSSEQTFIPMLAGIVAILVNTFLNYLLIYGKMGLPALGVQGAAIATVLAASVSLIINVSASYRHKLPSAVTLSHLIKIDMAFFRKFLKTIFPVILNEGFWALGITMYSVFYGRLGDAAVAAVGIYNTVDQLIFVTIYGLMHASSIVVGRSIGSGNQDEAFLFAKRLLFCAVMLGLIMGAVVFSSRGWLVSHFQISQEAKQLAMTLMGFSAFFAWARAFNSINVVGVLRAGGDTVFTMVLDAGSIWLIGVPLVGIAALVFRWPVQYVFLCTASEELFKMTIGLPRMLSRKWIHNVTHMPKKEPAVEYSEE